MAFTVIYAIEIHEQFKDGKPRIKLGEHFAQVDTWEAAKDSTKEYLKKWLKICRDDLDILKMQFWDFSKFSINNHSLKQHKHGQRIDDKIRHHSDLLRLSIVEDKNKIGISTSKVDSSEFHNIPYELVLNELDKLHIELHQEKHYKECFLSRNQHNTIVSVLEGVKHGKKNILADLAPRFGKTLWSLALMKELDIDVTIIASYVKTSFSSFKNDIKDYHQFKDIECVDLSGDTQFKKTINHHVNTNKKLIFFVSLCMGEQRNSKLETLFALNKSRLLIVDEADYGSHHINQSGILIKHTQKNDDVVILMTGTNSDRVRKHWSIQLTVNCTYLELLIDKHEDSLPINKLQHFSINPELNKRVCDLEFYQMDVSHIYDEVKHSLDINMFPSWSKLSAQPYKAKAFFVSLLEGVFKGKDDSLITNLEYQTKYKPDSKNNHFKPKVSMMFFSANNQELKEIADMTQDTLSNYEVFLISGGNGITNADSEKKAKDIIKQAEYNKKNVIFISGGMAQRSFSIPEIDTVFLCYDGGETGTTLQKLSRALTPFKDGQEKTGKIVSLSFDANRDDKFDSLIQETALNYSKNTNVDFNNSLRKVLKTINIFFCTEDGRLKIDVDEYARNMLLNRTNSLNNFFNMNNLDFDTRDMLLNMDINFTKIKTEVYKGETFLNTESSNKQANNTGKYTKQDTRKLLEALTFIRDNIDVIKYISPYDNCIKTSLNYIKTKELQPDIADYFNLPFKQLEKFLGDSHYLYWNAVYSTTIKTEL